MTKAEKFIQDYTNHCSNELEGGGYHEWLTPKQARRAVEIAKEEVLKEFEKERDERIKKVIKQVLSESTTEKDECYSNNRVTQQEVFVWIDKQGENNLIAKFQIGDKVRLKGSCGWYRVTDIRKNVYYLTSHDVVPCLLPICEQDNWEVEQKPAWSEEDEDYRQYVNAAVDNYFDVGLAKELRGWLYSLKERVKALKYYKQ